MAKKEDTKYRNTLSYVKWPNILLFVFLILTTPFLNFLSHNSYRITTPEIFIAVLGIIGVALVCVVIARVGGLLMHGIVVAGLLTLFLDIQFEWMNEKSKVIILATFLILLTIFWISREKFYPIATVVFLTFFFVTIGELFLAQGAKEFSVFQHAPREGTRGLPRIIHFVFDAHIGLEGIPQDILGGKELKKHLIQFYQKYGFRTHGGAFSHYFSTANSIPNLFNFSSAGSGKKFLLGEAEPYKLHRNRYFEVLSKTGYNLNVIGLHGVLDYCLNSPVTLDNCQKLPPLSLWHIEKLDIPISDKLRVIFTDYSRLSSIYEKVRNLYRMIQPKLGGFGVLGEALSWEFHMDGNPITHINMLKVLEKSVLLLPKGNVLFVHLLFPHAPFLARGDCSIKVPIHDWKPSRRADWHYLSDPVPNTAASREEAYQSYFEQTICLYTRLDAIFQRMEAAGIFQDSIIILHGDHGSRIVRTLPKTWNSKKLMTQDITDSYSTLFAVKIPGMKASYGTSLRPLEDLLTEVISEMGWSAEIGDGSGTEAFVYLEGNTKEKFLSLNYPVPDTNEFVR